jgi:hypothetical protein
MIVFRRCAKKKNVDFGESILCKTRGNRVNYYIIYTHVVGERMRARTILLCTQYDIAMTL